MKYHPFFLAFFTLVAISIVPKAHSADYMWAIQAESTTQQTMTINRQALKVLVFDEIISDSGTPKDVFVREIAKKLQLFSEQTNYEGCGMIQKDANTDRWGIKLSTNFSQIACFIPSLSLAGFESVSSIHSHPHLNQFIANTVDKRVQKIFGGPQRRIIYSNQPPGFSKKDLEGGAGYVVDSGLLFYHNGKKDIVALGSFMETNTYSSLVSPP